MKVMMMMKKMKRNWGGETWKKKRKEKTKRNWKKSAEERPSLEQEGVKENTLQNKKCAQTLNCILVVKYMEIGQYNSSNIGFKRRSIQFFIHPPVMVYYHSDYQQMLRLVCLHHSIPGNHLVQSVRHSPPTGTPGTQDRIKYNCWIKHFKLQGVSQFCGTYHKLQK